MATPLEEQIAAAAAQPASAAVDGATVTAHNLKDLIEADRHLSESAAAAGGRSGWSCTRPARVVPPGASGGS